MDKTKIQNGIVETQLGSWRDFSDHILTHHANCPAYVYRGQANADWSAESTLDRLERRFPKKRNYHGSIPNAFQCPPVGREEHLKAFKEAVRGRRGVNPPELTEDEWWALAQQHELATPMLDFTYSPFVALFFAFEEARCLNAAYELIAPETRVVYTVSTSVLRQRDDDSPYPFVPIGETSYRITNQAGLFLRMPKETTLEAYVRTSFSGESYSVHNKLNPTRVVERILIPNNDRPDCLKLLNKMNINRLSLFPDLDGAGKYLNDLWELDWDSSLGYLSENNRRAGVA